MISSKEESYSKRLQERDNEVANLKHRLRQATTELEDLHRNEAMRNMDNDWLVQDIQTITRENQFVKDELKKASDERDFFKEQTENSNGERMHLYQTIRATEIDKDDIQQSYKEVCFENQRFKEANS